MDYGALDYGDMNSLAILCAGLAYWFLGAIWYSAILSKCRSAIERHGVKLGQPGQSGMATRLIVTLICNLFTALVLAPVIHQVRTTPRLVAGSQNRRGLGLDFVQEH